MKNRRRFVLVPLAAAAAVLAFASLAYACTTVVGSISSTPNGGSVHRGDGITSTGSGLNVSIGGGTGAGSGTKWSLYFLGHKTYQDSMNTCMGMPLKRESKIGTTTQTQGSTNSVTVSGNIPSNAPLTGTLLGPALVCLLSENSSGQPDYSYATPSTEFTVV